MNRKPGVGQFQSGAIKIRGHETAKRLGILTLQQRCAGHREAAKRPSADQFAFFRLGLALEDLCLHRGARKAYQRIEKLADGNRTLQAAIRRHIAGATARARTREAR